MPDVMILHKGGQVECHLELDNHLALGLTRAAEPHIGTSLQMVVVIGEASQGLRRGKVFCNPWKVRKE